MPRFKVIGIVGLPGSGKTEVAKVAMGLNATYVRMGDVVWAEVERRGLELNEVNVGIVADEFRRREGPAAIAKRCIPLIRERGEGKSAVVIDGIRGTAEVEEFRRSFGDSFRMLGIWASERTRYLRVAERGREDDAASLRAFREKDARELGWGLGEALTLSDFIIVNEGALAELRRAASKVLKRWMAGKHVEAAR